MVEEVNSQRKRKSENLKLVACPIVFGSTAVHLGKKSDESATHRWRLYVRGPRNEDLSTFIQKIAFTLHPSFPEPVREVLHPPFEVSETGWGEFEASMRLYFKDPLECPVDLFHLIKLYPLGPPQPTGTLKKPAVVVAEQYDEILFCDPSDKFCRQLMSYTPKGAGEGFGKAVSASQGDQGSGFNTVMDDSQDVERLVAIQQHISTEIEVAKARLLQVQSALMETPQYRISQSRQAQQGASTMGDGAAGRSKAQGAGQGLGQGQGQPKGGGVVKASGDAKRRPAATSKKAPQVQQQQQPTARSPSPSAGAPDSSCDPPPPFPADV